MEKEFIKKVSRVQSTLKAPKGQYNKFGQYYYRSAEDILEAVKPLLSKEGLVMCISDDIVLVGDRFYVKATATITDGVDEISNSAFAREELSKKGCDGSQITGAASSYARKYALNGLFAIDDTKDADATNTHGKGESAALTAAIAEIKATNTKAGLMDVWNKHTDLQSNPDFVKELTNRKGEL